MRKLCSKRVPCLLTVDQKQQRIDDSERYLEMLQCNNKDFLIRYITMDKTWIHHDTLEWKQHSFEFHLGGSRPKRPKTQMSVGKVLTLVFWDSHGILFIDYLDKWKTINSEYYIALLVQLKEKIAKKIIPSKKQKNPLLLRKWTLWHTRTVDDNDLGVVMLTRCFLQSRYRF